MYLAYKICVVYMCMGRGRKERETNSIKAFNWILYVIVDRNKTSLDETPRRVCRSNRDRRASAGPRGAQT